MAAIPLLLFLVLGLLSLLHLVAGSAGDSSWAFNKCLRNCKVARCTMSDAEYAASQPWYMNLLGWDCAANCDYYCMWPTVQDFIKDGSPIPQFHGKWPFVRVLGIQEPASVAFSILNLLSHVTMLLVFRRKVPASAPMYYIWHAYSAVSSNAWLWSTVFHTRDTPFTEKMDYFCALSLVLFGLVVLAARVIGSQRPWHLLTVTVALLAFYLQHVYYMGWVSFSYGYNMKVNVAVGLVNSLGWFAWCWLHHKQQPYVWKAAVSILCVNALVGLELGDFPPLWWVFDAHSLWHAGTIPIPFLWYSFMIDDSLYQLKSRQKDTSSKSSNQAQADCGNNKSAKKEKVS